MKIYLSRLIIGFIFYSLVTLVSCKKEAIVPYILPENTKLLLTSDSIKTWKIARRYNGKTRMNMGDCFLKYRQRFYKNGIVSDNNAENQNCGPSLEATWEIITAENGFSYFKFKGDQLPELLGQEEDHKLFKILYLSNDSLTISFTHVQFSERRTITDYLVREDIEIKDRDFHW